MGSVGSGGARYIHEASTKQVALTSLPPAPEPLAADEYEVYVRLGEACVASGKLTAGDLYYLCEAARSYVDLASLRRDFREGVLDGRAITAAKSAYSRMLERLGLTPATRRAASTPPQAEDLVDPTAEYR
jgi:hypothetical protein